MTADVQSRARASRALDVGRRLSPPLRAGRFWLVQAGVLFVALLDVVVLDVLGLQPPFQIPRSTLTPLPLVPVISASLTYGTGGPVRTARSPPALLLAGGAPRLGLATRTPCP